MDDDRDFCNLLNDVFEQADYEVTAATSSIEALQLSRQHYFDLIVTDQRMPELSGLEFIRRIREVRSDVPIIMVSGYLDNQTIRELIRQGVGGVFMKPLNIFSLLKKATALIEKNQQLHRLQEGAKEDAGGSWQHNLPFHIECFPCKSAKSIQFALSLYDHRSFKTCLSLIGEDGANFEGVCRDLCQFQEADMPLFLQLSELNEDILPELILSHTNSKTENITLVIQDADELAGEAVDTLVSVIRREGPYARIHLPMRVIFCLHKDIDTLYEEGKLDDRLYFIMGTAEVRIPALREIAEDIPLLAKRLLSDYSANKVSFDAEAEKYLASLPWPGNYDQLRQLVQQVAKMGNDSSITEDYLRYLYENKPLPSAGMGAAYARTVHEYLKSLRDEYLIASLELLGGEPSQVVEALKINADLIRSVASKR